MSEQSDYTALYDFKTNRVINSTLPSQLAYLSIGNYVECMIDRNWYNGVVQEVCVEEGNVKVTCMHPKGPCCPENSFFWPSTKDICYMPQHDIIGL